MAEKARLEYDEETTSGRLEIYGSTNRLVMRAGAVGDHADQPTRGSVEVWRSSQDISYRRGRFFASSRGGGTGRLELSGATHTLLISAGAPPSPAPTTGNEGDLTIYFAGRPRVRITVNQSGEASFTLLRGQATGPNMATEPTIQMLGDTGEIAATVLYADTIRADTIYARRIYYEELSQLRGVDPPNGHGRF